VTDVVTFGECLASLVATSPGPLAEVTGFERFVAGAEANVAVGLARLGHSVAFIGRVGDDGFGVAIRRRLRGEGIDTTWLTTDPAGPTGVMFRERRAVGPSHVVYARTGSAGSRLDAGDIDRAAGSGLFDGARWLHLTGISPALSATCRSATERAIELARAAGLTISLDLNLRRRLWPDSDAGPVLRGLAAKVDIVLGSLDEIGVATGLTASMDPTVLLQGVIDLGPDVAIAKLGAAGSIAMERGSGDGQVTRPAIPLQAVLDPVGAGDAFCAGFIAGRLDGAGLGSALAMGNACGAAVAGSIGDQTGLPDRAQLAAILRAANDAGVDDTIR
jgi:2-dehydro-3-deoxygluconokinase